jgi:predicted ABC-type exoprotein transport system permease subunit
VSTCASLANISLIWILLLLLLLPLLLLLLPLNIHRAVSTLLLLLLTVCGRWPAWLCWAWQGIPAYDTSLQSCRYGPGARA